MATAACASPTRRTRWPCIIEQAGGSASTGRERILELSAQSLHQRVPLIMGSSNEVQRVEELHCDPLLVASISAPLFARRGFFRL